MAPGDFLARQRLNPQVSQETIRQFEIQFGFVDPVTGEKTSWIWQFGTWMKNIFTHLDFGYSFSTRQPVWTVIWERTLGTLWLSMVAMIIGLTVALPLGIYSAVRQYRWQDMVGSFVAFVGLSIPSVFLALLVLMFAAQTGWLPLGGMRSVDYFERSVGGKMLDLLAHVIGPAFVLGTGTMALYMRQMRGNLLDVLESDYVRTARAKGLSEPAVVVKHGVRNAINPVITLFGYTISDLLSGAVLVENVLAWPGLGRTVIEALVSKDLYLVMASVIMGSMLLILGNLVADLLLAWSDPRIRLR
jgi:peptide/nickel transport system permease protein